MKIEDQIRHFLRLAEDPGASASEREVAAARAEKLMVKYRIQSLPDVDSPREAVQVIKVWVEGGRGSLGPMHVIGLSNLAKTLSCAAIGFDCCGAEFEYVKPAEEEDDRFVMPLELAALAIAASRPMLAAVLDLGERLTQCEGWKPRERFTLKERLSEFGLDSGEHEVTVIYDVEPYVLGAFGEREPMLPSVESVKVSPELAEDDLERFRDALTKGGYESWMQLLHNLGYEDKERKWGYSYKLTARIGADGSLIRD